MSHCQHRGQPAGLRDTGRQHHQGSPVPHDLAVQSQLADHLDDGRGVFTVNRHQHLSPPVGHPPIGERVVERSIDRRR
ncbi:MAG TPA: hypothetical protein VN255_10330 [Mycobacterium sp.]|nr:hypothetical protein [Mycobacterium sp.]